MEPDELRRDLGKRFATPFRPAILDRYTAIGSTRVPAAAAQRRPGECDLGGLRS